MTLTGEKAKSFFGDIFSKYSTEKSEMHHCSLIADHTFFSVCLLLLEHKTDLWNRSDLMGFLLYSNYIYIYNWGRLFVRPSTDPDLSIFLWCADWHTQRRHTCLIHSNFNGTDSALNSPITHLVTLSVLDLASSNRGLWIESLSPLFLSLSYFFPPPSPLLSSPPVHLPLFCFCKPHNEFLSGLAEMLLFSLLSSKMLQLLTSFYLSSSNPSFSPCVWMLHCRRKIRVLDVFLLWRKEFLYRFFLSLVL